MKREILVVVSFELAWHLCQQEEYGAAMHVVEMIMMTWMAAIYLYRLWKEQRLR